MREVEATGRGDEQCSTAWMEALEFRQCDLFYTCGKNKLC
jgi:hypothetical protein